MNHSRLAGLVLLTSSLLAPVASARTVNPYFKNNAQSGDMVPMNFASLGGPDSSPGVAFYGNTASGGFAGFYALAPGATDPVTLPVGNASIIGAGQIGGITGGVIAGIVVARTVDNTPNGTHTGVFAFPLDGSTPLQLSSSNFSDPSYAPAMSLHRNKIVHRDLAARTGAPAIVVRDAMDPTHITEEIDVSGFASVGQPAVSGAGDVAFVGTPLGSSRANVYIHRSLDAAGFVSVIDDPNYEAIPGDQVALVDAGQGRVRALFNKKSTRQTTIAVEFRSLYQSNVNLATGTIGTPELLLAGTELEPLGDVFSVDAGGGWLSRKGYQYYKAQSDLNAAGLTTNPTFRLIGPGDAVDGSTVFTVDMAQSSLLANGDALLYLTLADGQQGFYFVSVPEPTTAMLLILPVVAFGRRRQRIRACSAL